MMDFDLAKICSQKAYIVKVNEVSFHECSMFIGVITAKKEENFCFIEKLKAKSFFCYCEKKFART